MPLDSVGPKMMLNRAPDATRDAAAIQRHSDLVKTQLDRQAQTDAERMAEQVVDVPESSDVIIQRERERERRQQQQEEYLEYELSDEEMALIEAEFERARAHHSQTQTDVGKGPIKRIDIRI